MINLMLKIKKFVMKVEILDKNLEIVLISIR
jgi:hypothetical protein